MRREQQPTYINRRTVARDVRRKTVTARRRRVIFDELRRAKRAIPRGRVGAVVRGREFAMELMDALIGATANRVPRIEGTSGRIVKRLIHGGYLQRESPPTARTIHAALTLIREVTPLVTVSGLRWEIALDDFDAEDPDELEHMFRSWREARAATAADETSPFGPQSDASATGAGAESGESAAQGDASAGGARLKGVPSRARPKTPQTGRRTGAATRLPRARARGRTFRFAPGSPSAGPSAGPTRSELLAEVSGHRWLRWVAAVLIRYLEAEPTIEALIQLVFSGGRHGGLGRRGRWSVRRAVAALVGRGWLVEGAEGWTIRPTADHPDMAMLGVEETPNTDRPSPKMSRHIERMGVDPRGLSRADGLRVQRVLHGRRQREKLSPRQLRCVVVAGGGLSEFDVDALGEHDRGGFVDLLHGVERERREDLALKPLPRVDEVAPRDAGGQDRRVSTNWNQVVAWATRRFGPRMGYELQLTGGSGNLLAQVRDASDAAIAA